MENIRHQLRLVVFSHYLQGFKHPSINSISEPWGFKFGNMFSFNHVCTFLQHQTEVWEKKVIIFRSTPPDFRGGEIGFAETRVFPIITLPFFHNGLVCMRAYIKSPQDTGVVGEN